MDLTIPYGLGDRVWAVLNKWDRKTEQCGECKNYHKKDVHTENLLECTIVGINIDIRATDKPLIYYTCDFDGYSTNGIKHIWKTKEEAEESLRKEE